MGLPPEGPDQGRPLLGGTKTSPSLLCQFAPIFWAEVCECMTLEVAPDVLGRIEFRGISGQSRHDHAPRGALNERLHKSATVSGQAIPDHKEASTNLPEQLAQEIDDLGRSDASAIKTEVKPVPGYPADHSQLPPVDVKRQLWRLSPRSPCASHRGLLAQSAFVNKDEGPAFMHGLVCNAGQV